MKAIARTVLKALTLAAVAGVSMGSASAADTSLTSTDGLIKVDLKPITQLTSADFDAGLFAAFPGWTVTNGANAAGALTSSGYTPQVLYSTSSGNANGGGAEISASYAHPTAPPAGKQFQYIQVASTTGFGPSYSTPHLDPLKNDDALPFYWTQAEAAARTNPSGSTIGFYDKPQAPISGLKSGPVSFTGKLFVSEWDGATSVTVRNGFSWGYDMSLATHGKSAGTFNNPSPTCPPATCTGVGTNAFTWGTGVDGGPPSGLGFAASDFTPAIDSKFVIGTLTFFNGTIDGGSGVDSLDMAIDLFFGFGTAFGTPIRLDASLSIINTPNGGIDPYADADAVSFKVGSFSGNFNVFEGQSASIPLYAELTSSGDVVAEKNLSDASFSGLSLVFGGFGPVTGGGFVTGVPEPGTTVLMALGLLLLAAARRARGSLSRR